MRDVLHNENLTKVAAELAVGEAIAFYKDQVGLMPAKDTSLSATLAIHAFVEGALAMRAVIYKDDPSSRQFIFDVRKKVCNIVYADSFWKIAPTLLVEDKGPPLEQSNG
jgi:hypothetical protein